LIQDAVTTEKIACAADAEVSVRIAAAVKIGSRGRCATITQCVESDSMKGIVFMK